MDGPLFRSISDKLSHGPLFYLLEYQLQCSSIYITPADFQLMSAGIIWSQIGRLEAVQNYRLKLFCWYTKGQIVPKKPSPAKDSTMAEMTPIYGSRNFEIK